MCNVLNQNSLINFVKPLLKSVFHFTLSIFFFIMHLGNKLKNHDHGLYKCPSITMQTNSLDNNSNIYYK